MSIWESIKIITNYKIGYGDTLLIGTTIGFLLLESGQFDVATMSAASSGDMYWIKAMAMIQYVPLLLF